MGISAKSDLAELVEYLNGMSPERYSVGDRYSAMERAQGYLGSVYNWEGVGWISDDARIISEMIGRAMGELSD